VLACACGGENVRHGCGARLRRAAATRGYDARLRRAAAARGGLAACIPFRLAIDLLEPLLWVSGCCTFGAAGLWEMPQRRSIVDEQLLDIIETYAWHDTVRGGGPAVLGLKPRRHRLFFPRHDAAAGDGGWAPLSSGRSAASSPRSMSSMADLVMSAHQRESWQRELLGQVALKRPSGGNEKSGLAKGSARHRAATCLAGACGGEQLK